jgi:site-specific DNA-methyltransferase (adenine-specific)/adenine-specific DNA-methyltransferase
VDLSDEWDLTILSSGMNQEGGKLLQQIFGTKPFAYPKPVSLLHSIIQAATREGDLILDSFAGSGTTAHAVLKLNQASPDKEPRRFILVEMEPNIARTVTAERVRRVAEGYTNAKGERVEGLGGGFRFRESGEPLFDEGGKIRDTVTFPELARHIYFTETGEPLPHEAAPDSPFVGASRGLGVYLLYDGVLRDESADCGNLLTRSTLAKLPPFDGQRVVYCAGSLLSPERLQSERIVVRQIPYEIRVA